jgi:UDP-N-acetylmuramoyl-tripeptide--D-alanyl-D-alanine ligase
LVSFQEGRLKAKLGEEQIELELPFRTEHQAENTLTAAAAYWALGLPLDRIGEGAAEIALSRLRGEELPLAGGGVLINDCWNANPASMAAALRDLAERNGGRRIAVLGGMAELGPDTTHYHREIGALTTGLDVVVGVGQLARDYGPTHWVADADAAATLLRELLEPGDVVLVKGSRAVGLERVAANIRS